MTTQNDFDYSSLRWVKQEIDQTLNQARHALEEYVDNPEDTAQLRFCATHIHQVYGTLQMVELYGAALLAEEMEQLLQGLLDGDVSQREDAYEVLMRAILQLPDYLEQIQSGLRDDPLILLPLLNDLRAARGEPLLSENSLFAPDIASAGPIVIENRSSGVDVVALAKRLRHQFQIGLLGWYRDQDTAGSLRKIRAVLEELEQATEREDTVRLWWVTSGVVEGLIDEGLEASVSLKLLLGQVDREIKRLIDNGESALAAAPATELLKNLLYYVARCTSSGERAGAVKKKFKLGGALPSADELESAREQLSGPNRSMMNTVADAIREDLANVKDALDLFLRTNDRQLDELSPHTDTLRKVADTLGMLGLGVPRKVIQEQEAAMRDMLAGDIEPSEDRMMEIAGALLFVESSLESLLQSRTEIQATSGAPLDDSLEERAVADQSGRRLPDTEIQQIKSAVIKEVTASIAKAKESVVAFIDAPWDHELLTEVPLVFQQVRGALEMIALDRSARLLSAVSQYVAEQLLEQRRQPEASELDTFADAVSSIEYYLEALDEPGPRRSAILQLAYDSLEQLGYPVERPAQPVTEDADTGEEASDAVLMEGTDVAEAVAAVEGTDVAEDGASASSPEPEPLVEELHISDVAVSPEATDLDAPAAADQVAAVADEAVGADEAAPADAAEVAADSGSAAPSRPEPPVDDDLDDDILLIFVEEAEEELEAINESLPRWRNDVDDHEPLIRIRRAFHTLKGSGRLVGAMDIGELAWSVENMLNRVLDETIGVTDELLGFMDEAIGVIPALLQKLKGEAGDDVDVQPLIDRGFALVEAGKAGQTEEPSPEEPVAEEAWEAVVPQQPESPPPPAQVMDPALYEIFSKESAGHLAEIKQFIAECQGDPGQCRVTDALVRSLHTLHGSARMAAADSIAALGGVLEKYIKALMANGASLPEEGMAALTEGIDAIEEMLPKLNLPDAEMAGDQEALVERIGTLYSIEQAKTDERLRKEQAEVNGGADAAPPEVEYDSELLEVFLEEGAEILDASEMTLQRWGDDLENQDLVAELQRELHTLKGGARMAGVSAVGDLSHAVESLLTDIVEGQAQVSPAVLEALHRTLDRLYVMLERTQERRALEPASDLVDELEDLRQGRTPRPKDEARQELGEELVADAGADAAVGDEAEEHAAQEPSAEISEAARDKAGEEPDVQVSEQAGAGSPSTETPPTPEPQASAGAEVVAFPRVPPADEAAVEIPPPAAEPMPAAPAARAQGPQEMVRVRADLLNDLVNYAGEVSIYRSRLEQQTGAFRFNLVEMNQTVSRLRTQLRKLEIETEAQILYRYEQEGELDEGFDPLELDRYSQLQQLSRALMEGVSDISSIEGLLENLVRESETLLVQQARVNTDLQEGLMRTRMVPFSGLVPRLRRLVRQTCQELSKAAELHVVGAQGEIDRTVLDRIVAPLEHMVRNAVAHGLELPERRQALGKPEAGNLTLTVSREGSEVVIQLADDGAGMDLDAIRSKAKERGLLDDKAELTDNDVMQFILESGFSTAQEVTQISGRGVGMDVVNSEIKQLGGSLHIDSRPEHGTTFSIRLPLTLALNQALLVGVGEETYALPLTSIEGIVRLPRHELEHYLSDAKATYNYAGVDYQVRDLGGLLGGGSAQLPGAYKVFPVLLVRSGDHRMALQVDGLMGSREIVVKSVGPQLSTVRGVSGATILGDGRVVLILDASALIRLVAATRLMPESGAPTVVSEPEHVGINVMVVDDSITVRKVTTRLLERNDMHVMTAKDGVDAVALLQEHLPDVMLLDIEMPRMDGFELATHIRNEPRLRHIPIIMITSRTGDKHRRRAEGIGVNRYLGKPYQESELLETIDELLKEQHGDA